jgi:hypothetical protein
LLPLLALGFSSCKGALEQTDLEEFVDTGLSNVLLRSTSFSPGSAELKLIPSATPIACSLEIVNPKSFDVSYKLSWSVDGSLFSDLPADAPTASSPTHLAFSFALDTALAEHKKIIFTLGKHVASINKTYEPETFSITCDSPPHAASQVSAAVDYDSQLSAMAIRLPTAVSDDDIAHCRIAWTCDDGSTGSAERAVSDLAYLPTSNPFTGHYDCYFRPTGTKTSHGYTYSVVLIDRAGQESASMSGTSRPNYFPLNYNGNGATGGSVPASASGLYKVDSVAVADPRAEPYNLTRTDYYFTGWNTKPDGSGGANRAPGSIFIFPAKETTLYAQWATTRLEVSLDIGIHGVVFTQGGSPVTAVSVRKGDSVTISCSSANLGGWRWYCDGASFADYSPPLTIDTSLGVFAIGSHTISFMATDYNTGLSYSGHFTLTVTQ